MKEQLNQLEEFQTVYNSTINQTPNLISEADYELRYKLGKEELEEYYDACKNGDLVEIADALTDQLYIIFGSIVSHGMQHIITDVFNEVHRSNMSKLGEDGKPIYREDGKVMKGPNFREPNLKSIL